MKFISLFAGIGGLDLGLERAGMECVAQVEIDDFCQKVLTKHWPDVPKFKDVRNVGKHNLPKADVICGGFPCQPHSQAGKRKGSLDDRDLWPEFSRIIGECKPKWVIGENVSGLLSSENGRFFGRVLRDLSASGYDVEWQSVPLAAFGAPHIRERILMVAYPKHSGLSEQGSPNWKGASEHITSLSWSWPPRPVSISDIPRRVDGISDRVDRLRSIGNAVSPAMGEFIGQVIMKSKRA